jgi:hypothetical protein
MERIYTRRRFGMLALACVALAACENTTEPNGGSELDANRAMADYRAMQGVFGSDGWAGVQALKGRTPMSSGRTVSSLDAIAQLANDGSGREFVQQFFRDLASVRADRPLAKTVISPIHVGKTFVYDPATDEYIIDPKRIGAPANGVRLIIYGLDANKRPILSKEIGYADLLDEGANAGNAVVLRLVVVQKGKTLIDYRARVDDRVGSGEIKVDGFVADDDGTKLTFNITATGTKRGAYTEIDADFDLAIAQRSFSVIGTVRGVKEGVEDGGGTIKITVRHGANSLAVDVKGDGGAIDGVVLLNGKTFATIKGDAKNPTVRGPTGQPLTEQEWMVLGELLKIVDGVFEFVEDLVRPVEKLLLLGWIL